MEPVKSAILILPHEENSTEALRKALSQSIKDPRARAFEEYRAAGLDSETAAALSDLGSMDSAAQAETILQQAVNTRHEYPVAQVTRTVVTEVPAAISNIGASAGSAIGSALGLVVLKETVKHSKIVFTTGISVAGIIIAVVAGKFVAASLGKAAGIVVATNVVSATGLISFAFLKRKL